MFRPAVDLLVAFALAAPPATGDADVAEPAAVEESPMAATTEGEEPGANVPEPDPVEEPEPEPIEETEPEPAAEPQPEAPPPLIAADVSSEPDAPAAAPADYKRPRQAGIGMMAAGGALMVAGAVLVPIFQLQADSITDDLLAANEALQDAGCPARSDSAANPMCTGLWDDVSTAKSDGRSATTGSLVGVAVLSVGVITTVAGAIVFGLNARRQKKAQQTAYILPSGLGVQGRF